MKETPGKPEKRTRSNAGDLRAPQEKKGVIKLGRPRIYETPEEMIEVIEDYLSTTQRDKWLITGLCIHLGLVRDTLIEYGKNPIFSDTVKRAKMMIESSYEEDLKSHGRTGTIFALKNFDWKDKSEIDANHSGEIGVTMKIINYSTNTHEDE